MNRIFDRKIILEDGTEFYGYGFGAKTGRAGGAGVQHLHGGLSGNLSDPSYTAQAVVMTYPLIGNYGMCNEDYETDIPTISGLVVREFNSEPSNFRAARTLEDVMIQYDIAGIAGVDTRRLARHIRDEGTCKALIVDAQTPSIACACENALHRSAHRSGFRGEYANPRGYPPVQIQSTALWPLTAASSTTSSAA